MYKKKQNKRDNPSYARKMREHKSIYPSTPKGCFGGKKTMSKLLRKFIRTGKLI